MVECDNLSYNDTIFYSLNCLMKSFADKLSNSVDNEKNLSLDKCFTVRVHVNWKKSELVIDIFVMTISLPVILKFSEIEFHITES